MITLDATGSRIVGKNKTFPRLKSDLYFRASRLTHGSVGAKLRTPLALASQISVNYPNMHNTSAYGGGSTSGVVSTCSVSVDHILPVDAHRLESVTSDYCALCGRLNPWGMQNFITVVRRELERVSL